MLYPINKARKDSKECAMERQKIQEIISILMESSLYFSLPVHERLELIRGLAPRVQCEIDRNAWTSVG